MPFCYEVRPHERLAMVTAVGQVDLRSAIETMGRVAQDPQFSPAFNVVVDALGMEYSPTLGELRVLAWALGAERSIFRNKIAVIRAGGPRHEQNIQRLARLAGAEVNLFCDYDSAVGWLHGC